MVIQLSCGKLYMCPHCSCTFAIEHNIKMHSNQVKKGYGQNGNNKPVNISVFAGREEK